MVNQYQYYDSGMYPGTVIDNPQDESETQDTSIQAIPDIQVAQTRIDQWSQIQNDESEYSLLWSDSNSFEPETFSENINKIQRWNNIGWGIAFLINLFITLVITFVLVGKYKEHEYNPFDKYQSNTAWKCFGIAVAVSILVNVIHLVYALFLPEPYIRIGIFIGVVYSIFFVAIPSLVHHNYICLLFPLLTIVAAIFFFILGQRNAKFSAAIFKQSIVLVLRYYQIMLFWILMTILISLINLAFSFIVYLVQANNWSNFFYIYVVFSFAWISQTITYISFMVASGLAASWYFLERTPYFPRHPILSSAKRAFTTSFGSASLAGLIMAIIQMLEVIVRAPPATNNQIVNAIIQVLKCIAQCILAILKGCFIRINQFALCYVSIYGVPFGEGVRRWFELRTKKFVQVLVAGISIERCLQYNMMIFVAGGSFLSLGLGYWVFAEGSEGRIFLPTFTAMISYMIFDIIKGPLVAIADTLIICFAEAPQMMKTSAYELYECFLERYGSELLNQKLENGKF